MLDFPSLKHKFSFFLDRKQTKITLDIASHSIIHSKHFDMPGFNETSTIRSLAFSFHDNIVTLYVDCVESSKLDIGIGLSKLYLQMDDPVMKLFRERKYPLHFDTSVQGAFGRANCQRGMHKHGNKRFTRNKLSADKGKSIHPIRPTAALNVEMIHICTCSVHFVVDNAPIVPYTMAEFTAF